MEALVDEGVYESLAAQLVEDAYLFTDRGRVVAGSEEPAHLQPRAEH